MKACAKTPYRFTYHISLTIIRIYSHTRVLEIQRFLLQVRWLSSRLHSENSKSFHTQPMACTFRSRCDLLPQFYFLVQRSERRRGINQRWSDNLKRTPVASRTILFSDRYFILLFKPAVRVRVFCFSFPCTLSLQIVTCGIISWDAKQDSS